MMGSCVGPNMSFLKWCIPYVHEISMPTPIMFIKWHGAQWPAGTFSPSSIVQLRDQLRSGPCIRPLHSTRSCPCNPLHSKMIKDESTWINQRLSCMFSSYLIISHLRTSSYVIISAMFKFECSHLASQIGSQKSTLEMISCKVEMPAAPPKLSTTLCAHCSRTLPGSGWRSTCTGKMPALGQWSLGTCSPWYSWWWPSLSRGRKQGWNRSALGPILLLSHHKPEDNLSAFVWSSNVCWCDMLFFSLSLRCSCSAGHSDSPQRSQTFCNELTPHPSSWTKFAWMPLSEKPFQLQDQHFEHLKTHWTLQKEPGHLHQGLELRWCLERIWLCNWSWFLRMRPDGVEQRGKSNALNIQDCNLSNPQQLEARQRCVHMFPIHPNTIYNMGAVYESSGLAL